MRKRRSAGKRNSNTGKNGKASKRRNGSVHLHDSLVRSCLSYLDMVGWAAFRVESKPVWNGKFFVSRAIAGLPDIIAIKPGGKFVGIEVKTGKARLREAQERAAVLIQSVGGEFHVVRSLNDLEEICANDSRDSRRSLGK